MRHGLWRFAAALGAARAARRRTISMSWRLQRLVRFPQLAVVDVLDAIPTTRGSLQRAGQSGPRCRS